MLSTMHLYPVNGAAQRVGKNDTAYSFREALFAEVIVGVDPDPANAERSPLGAKTIGKPCIPSRRAAHM